MVQQKKPSIAHSKALEIARKSAADLYRGLSDLPIPAESSDLAKSESEAIFVERMTPVILEAINVLAVIMPDPPK